MQWNKMESELKRFQDKKGNVKSKRFWKSKIFPESLTLAQNNEVIFVYKDLFR